MEKKNEILKDWKRLKDLKLCGRTSFIELQNEKYYRSLLPKPRKTNGHSKASELCLFL